MWASTSESYAKNAGRGIDCSYMFAANLGLYGWDREPQVADLYQSDSDIGWLQLEGWILDS